VSDVDEGSASRAPSERVGIRVAVARKVRGWTQATLAGKAHVSASLVSQVERGAVPASPAFVAASAQALGMTVADLYDQPAPKWGIERAHVTELETAVLEGEDGAASHLENEAEAVLARVAWLQRLSRYDESSAVLPDLLRALHAAAAEAPSWHAEAAHAQLAAAYSCALYCLHRLGSPLTGMAAERYETAAASAGDPLLAAVATASRSVALLHRGAYGAGRQVVVRALRSIEDTRDDAFTLAVRGSTHLQLAMIAARSGDRQQSDSHIDAARDAARFVPPVDYQQTDYYDTAFSAINVEFHAVAAAVELGDSATALQRGTTLAVPPGTMRSRLGHHHIDLAGAWLLHGDRDSALAQLNLAREITPQQTRYHPQVRETVAAIAVADRRRTDSLARFARWAGVAIA